MSEIAAYFVRHYTLVLDNDQIPHSWVESVVRQVVKESDVTLSEYLAMSDEDRESTFAEQIGEQILNQIDEWIVEATKDSPELVRLLIRELIITNGDSHIAWLLGKYYLPENSNASEFFDDEDSFEDDDEA